MIGAANDDFFVFAELHFDAGNGRADVAGFNGNARIVERAERGGFGETVGLQHRDAEHQKKLLRFGRERRGTANECAEIAAETLLHFVKNKLVAEPQPEAIEGFAAADVLALPGTLLRACRENGSERLAWRRYLRRRV